MKFMLMLFLACTLALLSGCSCMKVTAEATGAVPFDSISSYQWVEGPAERLNEADTVTNEKVQQALDQELVAKGWTPVLATPEADVQVAYYINLQDHHEYATVDTREREFSGGFTFRQEDKSWGYTENEPDLEVYTVEIGTLTVLLYDVKTGQRIWVGTLETEIDRTRSAKQKQLLYQRAASEIIGKIP